MFGDPAGAVEDVEGGGTEAFGEEVAVEGVGAGASAMFGLISAWL